MMRFGVNAKVLKSVIERVQTIVDKKASMSDLRRLYFKVKEGGVLSVFGTDYDHYLEVDTYSIWSTMEGVCGIDIEDIKLLLKMENDVDFIQEDENTVKLKNGKKVITLNCYPLTYEDMCLPTLKDSENICRLKENWLLETFNNLVTFTASEGTNKVMQTFNINTQANRIETLDGHRIGMRSIDGSCVNAKTQVMVHNRAVPVFKKLLNKKSENNVYVASDDKFVEFAGKNFTYIIRKVDGNYFDVSKMICNAENYRFTLDRENVVSVMKCDYDLGKAEHKPVVLHEQNGNLYAGIATTKYKIVDELEGKFDGCKGMHIGLNPKFMLDCFEIVDTDNVECVNENAKAPLFIKGNSYSFVVLPVWINDTGYNCLFDGVA